MKRSDLYEIIDAGEKEGNMETLTAVQKPTRSSEILEEGSGPCSKTGKIQTKTVWHIHSASIEGTGNREAWISRQILVNVLGCVIIFAMGAMLGYFVGIRPKL